MSDACRLYLITPPKIDDLAAFAIQLEQALNAGDVACVQLRLKGPDGEAVSDTMVLEAARALAPVTQAADCVFLINDRPDLAATAGADGVHIGQGDGSYARARNLLGDQATIGVTCHNSKHLALVAGDAGADYVAFGAFYPTQTKPAAAEAAPALLEWWRYATTVPCVAIGGITPVNCAPLVRAGADFLAVSSAIWSCEDGPAAAVKAFQEAIHHA